MSGFEIQDAEVLHLRVPIENPVRTSFGVMDARHAVFLRLRDRTGEEGLGESWVNFPLWAPWERAVAFERAFIPYLKGQRVADIPCFMRQMATGFRGPARQSGTVGLYVQALCAVEMALWDLAARLESSPLNQLLFERPAIRVPVYGSGINSPIPWPILDAYLDRGITLFKLKLGFGDDVDERNLHEIRAHLGRKARIGVDVNRGWSFEQAMRWLPALRELGVAWLEEPLRVEEENQLSELCGQGMVPIAAGENVLVEPGLSAEALGSLYLDIYQPDITKYCCLSDALEWLDHVTQQGKRLYPHFLGSGPGQAASLHLASGCGDTLLEWDVNLNPLHTGLFRDPFEIRDGYLEIPDRPGIGWTLDPEAVAAYRV